MKNQEICKKALNNDPHALEFVPDCYKTQEMCYKVVNSHSSTIQFLPESCKTPKICDKAFSKCFLAFFLLLIHIKIKKCVKKLFLMIFF